MHEPVTIYLCQKMFLYLNYLQEYIHRVGRTARAGGKGNALLLLMPEELGFLKYLKLAKVIINHCIYNYMCYVCTYMDSCLYTL